MYPYITAAAITLAGVGMASASTTVLSFEGLQDNEAIEEFYNGGTGSLGSSGPDVGVSFAPNALALIDSDAGGGGNFANEPTPDTIMFFLSGGSTVMNVADGFETGFSFFYTSTNNPGSVSVYDQVDAGGNLLGTLDLEALGSAGDGDPTGTFDTWAQVGLDFAGTARSVDFAGSADQIGFDQITFGSSTPDPGVPPIPVPAGLPLLVGGLAALGLIRRRA